MLIETRPVEVISKWQVQEPKEHIDAKHLILSTIQALHLIFLAFALNSSQTLP